MQKYFFLVIIIILLCSCSKPKNEIVSFFSYEYDIEIPVIDGIESSNGFYLIKDFSNEEFLGLFNNSTKVLYYYSLDSKLLKKKDTLHFLRYSNYPEICFIKFDSLIAFDNVQKIYFSYNTTTKVLNSKKVTITGMDIEQHNFGAGFLIHNSYVILPPWKYKKKGYSNYINCVVNKVYNDSSYSVMFIGNPMYLINQSAVGGLQYLKFIDDHNLIVNYSDYENLLRCNLITKKVDTIKAKSNFIDSLFTYEDNNNSREYASSYFDRAPSYANELVYDETKKMLFRFAHHPNDSKTPDGRKIDWLDKQWSLIGIDSTMKVVGEQVFPMFTYSPINKIVMSKRGLIVSNNNPNNPKDKKGVLSLSVFKRNY